MLRGAGLGPDDDKNFFFVSLFCSILGLSLCAGGMPEGRGVLVGV